LTVSRLPRKPIGAPSKAHQDPSERFRAFSSLTSATCRLHPPTRPVKPLRSTWPSRHLPSSSFTRTRRLWGVELTLTRFLRNSGLGEPVTPGAVSPTTYRFAAFPVSDQPDRSPGCRRLLSPSIERPSHLARSLAIATAEPNSPAGGTSTRK